MKNRKSNDVTPENLCRGSQPLSRCVGFTLVEILVVVLIIGILTAIAVPMYQSAVDKTHWSTLLPTARALKNAEEAYLMATNVYTDNEDALDVAATEGDATYQLQMPDSAARYVIRGSTSKLPNVRLAQYLDENASLAGQLHCEAKTGDERANKLCEKLLMGQELTTTDDGYTSYLLDQEVDKATCDGVNRSWSTSKTKCYKTTAERCEALGMGVVTGMNDQCGYSGGKHEIGAEGICYTVDANSGCAGSTITNGGICQTKGGHYSCANLTVNSGGICLANGGFGCPVSTFNGGICVSNSDYSCSNGTFTNGSICYANQEKSYCGANKSPFFSSYDATSCCCGNFCGSAPKCASSRCDPYYMDPNNFKDL